MKEFKPFELPKALQDMQKMQERNAFIEVEIEQNGEVWRGWVFARYTSAFQ